MKWGIQIHCKCGGYPNAWDHVENLKYEWENVELAKENLTRIQEHYYWYKTKTEYPYKEIARPKWFIHLQTNDHLYLINLKLDNEKDWVFIPFWMGAFHELKMIEVIQDMSGMRYYL